MSGLILWLLEFAMFAYGFTSGTLYEMRHGTPRETSIQRELGMGALVSAMAVVPIIAFREWI